MACRLLDACRIEDIDGREPPGSVDDDPDTDPLVLEQLNGCDQAVLDGEALHRAVDHPAVGIRRAGRGCRIERSLADLTHEGGV